MRSPVPLGLDGPAVVAAAPADPLRSSSPETTLRYKSRGSVSVISRNPERFPLVVQLTTVTRAPVLSDSRHIERSAERRVIRTARKPPRTGGSRSRRKPRERRGAGRGPEDGNPYRRAERAQRATTSRTGCRKPDRRPTATATASSRKLATGISSRARTTAPTGAAAAGSEVKGEAARPAAQRPLGASSPERGAGANGAAHRLDRPSDPPAGSQRKTERTAGDRREPANERRRRSL